ncbi:hypothetical protein Patl1_14537 [Pistacia atlantica]|uniref:Uncharacterized protein n=1 Tax=Pistacia atlantica TaxID=434234 RepID=A0ACC1AV45_9ROSI|nr:hypothetical protein Patl1_14537 [Pistacia atlantica]
MNQNQGPTPVLVKAEVLCILNKLTPEKFDLVKGQLMDSGITSAVILQLCLLYMIRLFLTPHSAPCTLSYVLDLNEKLPPIPSDEPGGKEITVKRLLLNNCQEAFEGSYELGEEVRQMTTPEQEMERRGKERMLKLRTLGNIRLISELVKQKMKLLGHDSASYPAEENVEAVCQVFNTIDLRTNNWVPRREKVKGKKITEIHSGGRKNLGLRPGATTSIRNNRISGAQVITGPGGMPITRPWPRWYDAMVYQVTRKILGMQRSTPRGDGAGIQPMGRVHSASLNTRLLPQEPSFQSPASSKPAPAPYVPPVVEKPQAPAVRLNMDELGKKTVSLLKEYFSILDLGEALTCVEELKAPGYHPEFVKESISLALEKGPPRVDPLAKLLEHLAC